MPSLHSLIPFVTLPFLFPGVAASSRLLAIGICGIAALLRLLESPSSQEKRLDPFFACFYTISFLCIGGLLFFKENIWFSHMFWPIGAWGLLFFFSTSGNFKTKQMGLSITVILLWILIWLTPYIPSFFPSEMFPAWVKALSQQYRLDLYPIRFFGQTNPISHPEPVSMELVFHAAVLLTTGLGFLLFFHHLSGKGRYIFLFFLSLWGVILLLFAPKEGVILIGAGLFIFSLFCRREFKNKRNLWYILGFCLVVLVLAVSGVLSPILYRLPAGVSNLKWEIQAMQPLSFSPHFAQDLSIFTRSFSIYILFISAMLLLYFLSCIIWQARRYPREAAFHACGCFLLFFTAMALFPDPLLILFHPVTWLAVMLGVKPAPALPPEYSASFQSIRHITKPKLVAGGAACLLLGIACFYLYCEWKAEAALIQLMKNDRYTPATLFDRAAYRGDTAAVYSTLALQNHFRNRENNTPPASKDLMKMETALYVSMRYDYIPILACKRFADLLFYYSDAERSIRFLAFAAKRFPHYLPLNTLWADQLEMLNRWDEAERVYRHCINLNPTSPILHKRLALVYKRLGDEQRYKREIQSALILDPSLAME